ncbi:MAG: type topoisomerase, partial [Bacteroidota bacterium]
MGFNALDPIVNFGIIYGIFVNKNIFLTLAITAFGLALLLLIITKKGPVSAIEDKYLYDIQTKIHDEIKVAQLAAYVSEHTAYLHGEVSLQEAIIGMAQIYPGSNNICVLHPSGNHGHRNMGGKDHASPRYIFTNIEPL